MKHIRIWAALVLFSAAVLSVHFPPAEAKEIPADAPEINYFGRWEDEGGVYRCGYGATYVEMNFTGTSLRADLYGENIYWRVSIDGNGSGRFLPQGEGTVLAEHLAPGAHKLRLVRLTEGRAGISEIRGFAIDDGAELLPPDPMKKRRLEFVGDSVTAGAESEGPWGNGVSYYEAEDGDMSYGPQLARLLGADYSIVAKSGQGVVRNYAESWPYDGVHAADSYPWTFFSDDFGAVHREWDAERFPVDAVLIAIGTNDFNEDSLLAVPPSGRAFRDGYRRLIETVRAGNPGKPIICLDPIIGVSGSVPDEEVIGWIRQTVDAVNRRGDTEVYFIPVNEAGPLLGSEDLAGGNGHPLRSGSARVAACLKDKVAAILGW